MESEVLIELVTILLLVVGLAILMIALLQMKKDRKRKLVFNTVFIIFLISWIIIEILHLLYFDTLEVLISGLHFAALGLLAIWMNVHFYKAIQKVKDDL